MTNNDNSKELIEESIQLEITPEILSRYTRLDHFLTDELKTYSRTFIRKIFEENLITSGNKTKLSLSRMPNLGEKIEITIPPPTEGNAAAENIPLEIIYEDEFLAIVNKPAGMVTHPAPGNYRGTLVNAILHHCPDIQSIGNVKRPGIVHRLDKGTSGVMVIAKTQKAHERLVLLFSKHDIKRQYVALVHGTKIPSEGIIQSTIGRNPNNRLKMKADVIKGKTAITHYKILNYFKNHSLAEFTLETGRTHQIRVHTFEKLNAPILCDETYGNQKSQFLKNSPIYAPLLKDYPYPLLHAKILGFIHPITNKELLFESALPEVFSKALTISHKEQP